MKQDLVIRIEHTKDRLKDLWHEDKFPAYSYRLWNRTIHTRQKIMNQDAKSLFDLPK